MINLSSRYIPPIIKHQKTNIKNSDNTALFLTSCFEYIFAGVVLNAGPPFRQGVWKNLPFVATIAVAVLITLYMILGPAHWVKKLMQLTKISWSFKGTIIGLGVIFLVVAWVAEHYLFPKLARLIGQVKEAITQKSRKRKEYKLIQERMRT